MKKIYKYKKVRHLLNSILALILILGSGIPGFAQKLPGNGGTPIISAGNDVTICENTPLSITDASATNYISITWTSDGDGTWSPTPPNTINPIYYPGTNDKDNLGFITLMLTANPGDVVSETTDTKTLIIQDLPLANAGEDATICDTQTYTLSDATASNYSAITWTTGGDGSFSSTSALNPTYTPGTLDKSTGSVTLTITAVAEDPCTGYVDDDILITIQASPTAGAGDDVTICDTETYTLSDATASNYSAITWTTGGDGSFSSTSALNPTYTPGTLDKSTGSVTLTITAVAEDPCTGYVDDDILITIQASPTAGAGDDVTICDTETYTLSDATATNYSSLTWTTDGDGSFSSTSVLNPTYTPGTLDKSTGSVTLIITAVAEDPCTGSVDDDILITIQASPTAGAGDDATICDTETYTLSDATASNYSAITWTTGGDGSFSSTSALNPTYTPGTSDKSTGSVTLTIATVAEDPCAGSVDDDILITIQASPTAGAGDDATICDTETYTLSDATASNYSAVTWTTDGDGSFSSTSALNPTYSPGTLDKSTGSVTLTITAVAEDPCTGSVDDDILITIQPSPTAAAGDDATICDTEPNYTLGEATADNYDSIEWTTSGDGSFDDDASLNPIYTPGVLDISNGSVTLTITAAPISPCGLIKKTDVLNTDDMVLTIQSSPIAYAGIDATICEDGEYEFDDADLQNEDDYLWETSGDGTFVPPFEGFRPSYFPGTADIAAGTVEICLTANAISPCVVDSTDCMTLTIESTPTADAGGDATICEDDTYTLSDASAANYLSITWTTSGDGSFDDDSEVNPTYTPGSGDASSGSVTLTITAAPNDPCTTSADDDMILSIGTLAIINAGPDANICTSGYKLKDATADDYLSLLWVTFGDGTFSDGTAIQPFYYPGTNDLVNGHVKLSLVASPANNPPCVSLVYDDIELTITQDHPTVFAGADATACEDAPYTFNGATATDFSDLVWHTYGDGSFDSEDILASTYTPGSGDILIGSVKIKLVASPIYPCLFLVEDEMILTFQNNPIIQFPGDDVICEDGSYTFISQQQVKGSNNVNVSNFSSISWTGGDGTFTFPSTYCMPSAGSLLGTVGFKQFNLGSINNSTGQSSGGYGKYLNLSTALTPGVNNSVYWTTGYATANASLWIDFNMDGTFQTSERLISSHLFATSGNNTSFTVPIGTPPGEKRLRIRVRSVSGSNDPCANFTYGETEDYTVIITGTNGTIVPPTYTPGPTDIANETVELCLTAQPINPCVNSVTECMTLDIQLLPVANAGGDDTVCEDSPYTISGASASYQSSVLWTSDGTGSFDNSSTVNPIYTPSAADITDGSIELCMTAEPISPCATSDEDCMTLAIQLLPVADAGDDDTVCEDASYTLSDATAENYSSVTWTTNGDGSFDDPNVIMATYTPGTSDISTGSVTLTLTAEPVSPCSTSDSDDILLTIQLLPTAEAGSNATICEDDTHTVSGASAANYLTYVWTGGDGTFDADDILAPTYTPGATDISTGSVYLLLTAQPITPCTTAALDSLLLTIQKNPTVDITADSVSICYGESYTFTGVTYTDNSSVFWYTVVGGGTWDDDAIENPTYQPSPTLDYIQGCINLYVLASPISPCTVTVTDSLKLCFQAPPIANAGSNATICEDDTYTLSGASASNYNALSWTGGDGSFDDNTALQPTYTLGSTDITNGTVELCLTAEAIDPCTVDSTDCITLTIQLLPIANPGGDATICEDDTYTLSDATAENYSSVTWTTDGTGTFNDVTDLNPTYTPSAADITDGSIELCLTAEPVSPCTTSDEECMTLTIQFLPIADAGDDGTVCEDGTYTLSDATAENYSTVTWTTNGTGSFDDPTLVIATYDPSAADILAGSVTLTLTAEPESPCTVEDTDEMILTIQLLPIADAGDDDTICEDGTYTLTDASAQNYSSVTWTSSGTGTFANPAIVGATYDPSDADILLGSVTLTLTAEPLSPCTVEDTDDMILDFQLLPIADAGDDGTVCEDASYTLSDATAENYSSVTWTTDGTGTFTDPTIIMATYNPSSADILAGSVELCLTAEPESPCTTSDEECMTLTIQLLPIADAGEDATICEDGTYTLSGATAENEDTVEWTSSGTGSFDDATLLSANYDPSAADILLGSVTLTLTAEAISPCSLEDTDDMVLYFQLLPIADAGDDDTVCEDGTYTLSDATAENYSSVTWTSSGTGTFANPAIVGATYNPSAADILLGSVTLTLTAEPLSPCTVEDTDDMILDFQLLPIADAGNDGTVCEDASYTLSDATAENYSSVTWTTNGTGAFDDETGLNPTYTPSAADILAGSVELCLTAEPEDPCTTSDEDCMTLAIQLLPIADAGDDSTICEDGTYTLSGATAENESSVSWATDGTGSFDDNTLLGATYSPSADDIAAGSVELCLTAEAINPCNTSDEACMTLYIQLLPIADAGSNATICEDATFTVTDAAPENYSSVTWTTDGTGTFSGITSITPTYTPSTADILAGSVELCITAEPESPCTTSDEACMTLTIQLLPIADAGEDATICEDGTYTLSGATSENESSVSWATDGTGSFDDNTLLGATYTPSADDIAAGSVELCLTTFASSPCTTSDEDCMTLTINYLPSVEIGFDGSLCVSDALELSDATAVGYSSLLWTTDGDGTFTDETVLNPTYTPGSGDIVAGSFELCLTAQPISPCTGTDEDCVTVTFFPLPIADAGDDATVCENKNYKLSGDASITIETEWVTSGDGTFNDVQLTDATYTPGANDIINGSVELCFKAYPIAPCTEVVEDCMILTIQGLPVADAGDDATICEDGEYTLSGSSTNGCGYVWSTAGDGSFDDITIADATYTPGADDILAGSVVLTLTANQCSPCLAYTDDDQMTLTINKFPTIVANDDSVCETGSITLTDLTAENYSSVSWTTDGDGYFDDPSVLNAVYTPGSNDISNLSVTLTITVEPIEPCVGNASDDMTLSVIWTPAAYAGEDVSILYDEPYTLENADAADYGSLLWTTGGDGTFSDDTDLNPVYTPGAGDISNGSVILTLTAYGSDPCTETSADDIMLSIFHAPEVVITSPLHGDILYFNPVLITGTASDLDNDLAYVEIRINGGPWLLVDGLETWQLEVELLPCDNLIEARATDVEFFESDIDQIHVTMNIQIIPVVGGWQYISTFLTPLNTDLNVMNQYNDPIDNLFIMVDANGKIYSPPLNTNTIGNWNPYKGYKAKMNTAGTWTIHGNPVESGSVALPSGFSIFPVLTNYEVPVETVLTNPLTDVLIIFEIQTNNIYWPDGDLFTLTSLKPGYGYLGNFKNPVTVTFPEVICGLQDSKTTYETVANDGPWPITRTANVHLVSIANSAVSELNNADYIGAFDADGNCIGYAAIDRNNGNYLLTIYGDDQMTPEKDGASENEIITFAAYDNFDRTQVVLHATFDNLMPQNNGLFASNGLSKILSFKESATGIGEENIAEMVSIYPNPARDEITISYPLNGTNSTVNAVFTNTAGKQVMTKKLNSSISKVDVSNLAPGIYMVTLQNNDNVVVKRLIVN